ETHATQQPEPRHTGAGADLDDSAGVEHGGQEAEGGADPGPDRGHPHLFSTGARRGEHLVLGHELLGPGPTRGLDRVVDDCLLRPRCRGDAVSLSRAGRNARNIWCPCFVGAGERQQRRHGERSGSSQSRSLRWRSNVLRRKRQEAAVTTDHVPTWEEIVSEHSDRVYRLAYRLTGNAADAEDLTQDVFVRVFRSLSTYSPGT